MVLLEQLDYQFLELFSHTTFSEECLTAFLGYWRLHHTEILPRILNISRPQLQHIRE